MAELTKSEIREWMLDTNRETPVVITTVTVKLGPLVLRRAHRHADR